MRPFRWLTIYLPIYKMDRADQRRDDSELYHSFTKGQSLSSENTLTYSNSINMHNFTVLAGFSAGQNKWSYNQGVGIGTPTNALTDRHFDSVDPAKTSISGRTGQGKGVSSFGRIIYRSFLPRSYPSNILYSKRTIFLFYINSIIPRIY